MEMQRIYRPGTGISDVMLCHTLALAMTDNHRPGVDPADRHVRALLIAHAPGAIESRATRARYRHYGTMAALRSSHRQGKPA